MDTAVGHTETGEPRPHPRTIGWLGTTALAMGGSNQSLFLIAALFVGQGDIAGQGSAAVPLLVLGLLLSWAAAPGWTELVLMFPNRVGGIAASCSEAFRPYSPVLSALAGGCYWWGWVPACGLTAILSASAIHQWYLPGIPVNILAIGIICAFVAVNLCGIRWVVRLALPVATISAGLAFLSAFVPILTGHVDWHQATTFHLTTPFPGWFGGLTSLMAGLYLIGFAAPAFEAATCHVGETVDPARNVPRAMVASAAMAGVYFIVLPVVWLGVLGPDPLGKDLALQLGPTFAPLFGSFAKAAAIGFMMFNMFHGTLQPLAGAARTLAQLAEDGIFPRSLALRLKTDAPWVATLVTAAAAIVLLLVGDPIWLIAAASFTYLISICLPSVAVWLLRRDAPTMTRPYRAPRGAIGLGLGAATIWGMSAVLGFEQFGLRTVIIGLVFAYAGAGLYAWRKFDDRRRQGLPGIRSSLHLHLTGAMVAVLVFDGIGYFIAIQSIPAHDAQLVAEVQDIFVVVALLTVTVGLVLPGLIAHAANEVSQAARQLVSGTVADFTFAMEALGRGDLDAAHIEVDVVPVVVHSRDELGDMAASFNALQVEIGRAATGLGDAREGLQTARTKLTDANTALRQRVAERTRLVEELIVAKDAAVAASNAKGQFLAKMSHEIRTPMNGVLSTSELLLTSELTEQQRRLASIIHRSGDNLVGIIDSILDLSKLEAGKLELERIDFDFCDLVEDTVDAFAARAATKHLGLRFTTSQPHCHVLGDPIRIRQVVSNLLANAIKFTEQGRVSVELTCRNEREDDVDAHVELIVRDTGIGIPSAYMSRLFEPFSQADDATTRIYGGTGLGLAIVKQILDLLGGQIHVESAIGEGSTFHVRLQLQKAMPSESSDRRRADSLDGLRCLICDSDAGIRDALQHQLQHWRVSATAACDGADVLARLDAGEVYPIAIIASQLIDMNGLDLIDRIRRSGKASDTAIIVSGSIIEPKDEVAMDRLRISTWLSAPTRQSELYNALLVARKRSGPGLDHQRLPVATNEVPMHAARSGAGYRILLAEDNIVNQEVTAASASYLGYELDIVGNGAEAVAAFRTAPYDLILMDCHMPVMDGFDATREIRRIEGEDATGRIPIVALSANAMKGDKEQCLQCGMDDHLAKPFRLDELQAMVEHRARRATVTAEPAAREPMIDTAALERIVQLQRPGRPDVLEKVVHSFTQSTPALLDALENAVIVNDFNIVRAHAHSLKSSSANLGAMTLSRLFRELETFAGEQPIEEARVMVQAIRDEYSAVCEALLAYLNQIGGAEAPILDAVSGHG